MHRCPCSSRALEIFIKDFAGLNIRQHPFPRAPIRRTFGTRPSRRQHVETRGGEDGFVPFEFEKIKRSGSEAAGGNVGEEKRALGVEGDEELHAEIEIAGSWPKRTRDLDTEQAGTEEGKHRSGVLKGTEGTQASAGEEHAGEDVAGRDVQPPSVSHESVIAAAATSSTSAADSIPDGRRAVGGRSRAENRLARKQRRMLAGNFAPAKAERGRVAAEEQKQDDDDDGVASVLEKIEGMAGPPVRERMRKGAETSPPTKWALKKRRAIEKNAKEQQLAKTKNSTQSANTKFRGAKNEQSLAKTDTPTTKPKPEQELWQSQKAALQSKFGAKGWDPSKKVSPDTMAGIRALHHSNKAQYNTATLSKHFEMSPEAIRRILRSKWTPTEEEAEHRRQRWEKRGVRKWDDMAKKGIRPPKKWREAGVGWERKSRSLTKRSGGLQRGRTMGGVREREGELEEGVGMLSGIDEEERIL